MEDSAESGLGSKAPENSYGIESKNRLFCGRCQRFLLFGLPSAPGARAQNDRKEAPSLRRSAGVTVPDVSVLAIPVNMARTI